MVRYFFSKPCRKTACVILEGKKMQAGQSPAIEYRTYKKEDQNKKQSLNKKKTA
jgi:hypothetical protein